MSRRKFLYDGTLGTLGIMYGATMLTSCTRRLSYDILNDLNSDVPYRMKHIRGNVGYFTEKGGTIGWYTEKNNCVIIDTQFPEQVENLLGQLTNFTDMKIEAVYNTHHHQDHTSGNKILLSKTKTIIAHQNSLANQQKAASLKGNAAEIGFPNITFEKTHSQKIGGETIKCDYFGAAHTNGDMVVHFQNANVAHIGDLVFNRRFPYIDKGAGAHIGHWVEVLDQINNTYDNQTMFICGHSGSNHDIVINKEDINAFKNYLEKLLDYGRKSFTSGMTLEELKKNTTTIPGAEEWQGDGVVRSLEAVYYEIEKEQ